MKNRKKLFVDELSQIAGAGKPPWAGGRPSWAGPGGRKANCPEVTTQACGEEGDCSSC